MKNEAEHKRTFIADLHMRGHYGRRIEDMFSVGFPDMVVKLKGWPICVIEAKIVRNNSFAPTDRQYVELLKLHDPPRSYGLLMGFTENGEVYFAEPTRRARITDGAVKMYLHPIKGLESFLADIKRNAEYEQ